MRGIESTLPYLAWDKVIVGTTPECTRHRMRRLEMRCVVVSQGKTEHAHVSSHGKRVDAQVSSSGNSVRAIVKVVVWELTCLDLQYAA